jgi:phosphopantetheinyl transferase (holo-ACP synthase)
MNILGLGFDATDIPRIGTTFERYGDRLPWAAIRFRISRGGLPQRKRR